MSLQTRHNYSTTKSKTFSLLIAYHPNTIIKVLFCNFTIKTKQDDQEPKEETKGKIKEKKKAMKTMCFVGGTLLKVQVAGLLL